MKPNFENHRKDKVPASNLISVIDEDGKVWNGWTNGRSLEQISEDFGVKNVDWFYFIHKAEEYLIQHRDKFKK